MRIPLQVRDRDLLDTICLRIVVTTRCIMRILLVLPIKESIGKSIIMSMTIHMVGIERISTGVAFGNQTQT